MSETNNIPLVGGLLAGIAASACCVGPLVLLLLGFGGAWVSNLTALEPYRPIFIGIALVALFMAYQRIYKPKAEQSCEINSVCAKPQVNNLYRWLFIGVVVIVLASIASPYLISLIYGGKVMKCIIVILSLFISGALSAEEQSIILSVP